MIKTDIILGTLIMLAIAFPAHAEEKYCNSMDWHPPFTAARIIGNKGTTVPLETYSSRIPDCRQQAKANKTDITECEPVKVTPGQEVIVAFKQGDYACVGYNEVRPANEGNSYIDRVSKKPTKQIEGWVKIKHLQEMGLPLPKIANWEGRWYSDHSTLDISVTPEKNTLHVYGAAAWQGWGDPRFGKFKQNATLRDNHLHIAYVFRHHASKTNIQSNARSCIVDVWKVDSQLFAADNGHCGATNVRFNGIYWKDTTNTEWRTSPSPFDGEG